MQTMLDLVCPICGVSFPDIQLIRLIILVTGKALTTIVTNYSTLISEAASPFWYRKATAFIEVLDIPSNRITGIELNIPDTPNIYLISVYLPAVTQSYELFSKEVEILIDVYNIYSTMGTVVLMGDFNCKIEGPRYTFDYDKRSDSFRSFMQECNLRSLHLETNGIGPVCTFQSYQGGPKTAIDHIIVSIENLTKLKKIQVPDEHMFNVSDHKPIRCSFALSDNTNYVSKDDDLTVQRRISWTKAVQNGAIADYSFAVSQFLWDIKSPTATPANIEQYYSEIVNAILRADMETLPGKQYVKHLKPYWTKTVKEYHTIMRLQRRTWIENGKFHDRNDKHYSDYKSAKLNFRKQLELAYENYISEINRKIEESVDCDQRFVWSVIKSGRKSVSHCQQLNISGIQLISSDEIRDGWVTHFQSVFSFDSNLINPVNEKAIDNTINDLLETVRTNTNEKIEELTFDELYKLCDNLPCNKSQVFINDLLKQLDESPYGSMLFNLRVSSTVQADDIALISTTSKCMKTLIDICQTYSENWGFRFSSAKSEVLKFCSSKCATISQPLKLYGADIPVVISTKHVGILLNAEFKSMSRTLNACRILRATALSVMKSGIHPSFLNPLTCSKIVFQMCYPKAMFACELWYGLSNTELTMLERSHKYICKTIQGLPARTRSDKCTSLLGWLPVECYIDKCKLQFFGRLCRMDNNLLPKRILLLRLLEFRNKCSKKQDGFVPDLIKIAVKYDLINFVEDFVKSGSFPSKAVWNRYISTSIANSENNRWQQRISVDSDFEIFRKIHKHIVPHRAWVIAKTNPNFREGAKVIVDLCSVIRSEESPLLCDKCGQFFYNIIEHIMCMCDRLSDLRAKLWEDLISINPIVFSVYLDNLTSSTFTATLLSCYTEYDLDNDNSIYFSKTCITHVQRIINRGRFTRSMESFRLGQYALSVLNIWKTSPVKRVCDRVKDRTQSNTYARSFMDGCAQGYQHCSNLLGEFQRVDGDIEDKAEWLKDKTVFYLDILKTRAINHPRIVDLRTRWSNLNDDKKFWYSVLLVITLFLLVADVQNENGLFQLVTWPVCKTMFTVLYEMLRILFYIPVRPVFGLIRCAIEVLWILVDIVINTILCLMNIVTILLLLPAT
ncbi:unnamed protein product [Mytilus edulis]|uniref:Endonuclease/exonuclease/phosphatase domain-containing protein n=1 Tax=Mytilus edulis TaxID=6550 RepID=A0A8S3V9C1_MYTED|nr:unnamed protein product [Mytilus edulis]